MIPSQTTYDNLKPYGYKSEVKTVKFSPISGNVIVPNDIVRFQINTKGYWDPTTCYLNLTVALDDTFDIADGFQIDGGGSSFIAEFQASSNGTVFENIREYDQMANFLEDMNYSNEQRFTKDIAGMGNNCKASTKSIGGNTFAKLTNGLDENTFIDQNSMFAYGFNPHLSYPPGHVGAGVTNCAQMPNTPEILLANNDKVKNNITWYLQESEFTNTALPITTAVNGFGVQVYKNLYGVDTNGGLYYHNNSSSATANTDLKTQMGLGLPYNINNDLSQGCFEPALVKGVGLQGIYDGVIKTKVREKIDLCVPFYSGVFGCLMPKDSLKYIPMSTLSDLILEFRINPYAVFTSGIQFKKKDGTYDATYSNLPSSHNILQRKFKITKFEIVVDLLYFDEQLENLTKQQFNSLDGIVFHTISWHNISSFVIPAGQTPSGNYTIQKNYDSLKALIITFLPNDYLTNPNLRKLYRINNSITSLQLSINHDFFPPYPLKGHAGTSGAYNNSYAYGNNNDYLINLYKCFDKFNNYDEDCSINSLNFAVNNRYFNSKNTRAWLSGDNVAGYVSLSSVFWGPYSLLQENLIKGKALYAIDLQTLGDDKKVISGLNTKQTTIDIIITSDSNNPYYNGRGTETEKAYSTTMYVWCLYDVVINIQKNKVQSVGIN